MNDLVKFRPPNGAPQLPDHKQYKGRFQVKSSSNHNLYTIAFLVGPNSNYWTCSCRGCISHGQCKHLSAAGLKGRKYGPQIADGKKFGFIQ
jgi:hypothetical protein